MNYISKDDYDNINKRSNVDKGDILFGMIGTIGNPLIVETDDFAIKNVALIKEKEELLNKFLIYVLETDFINKQFYRLNAGGTQKFIALGLIKDLLVPIPSIEEQLKISEFLSVIDLNLNSYKNQISNMEKFKKYLMQQIFAQKLRFDFDDEWKQYKLKDLLTVKSSSISINQLEDNPGTYPLYGASGFLKNIDFCEMKTDYISIVKDGSRVGNLSYHEKNSSIVNTSQYLLPKKNFDIHFLYYLLQTLNLLKYVNGSSIPHIYFKDYCIEKVDVPCFSEQQQIGKLFVNTDKTLKNINNSIKVTQEFKKGLLQQMFNYMRLFILFNNINIILKTGFE